MKNTHYLRSVVTLKLTKDLCIDCGECVEVCPRDVFDFTERILSIKQKDFCIECGACVKNCPTAALEVKPGVGCATAIIYGMLNKSAPCCDCNR